MSALSRKSFHAMEAVLFIACYRSTSPVSSKEIAAKQELPPRYLEQMLQKLVKANILRGVRGPRGGYLLAREKRRITMGDIYDVIEEDEHPMVPVACGLGDQVLLPLWKNIHQQTVDALSAISLSDCCDKADALEAERKLASSPATKNSDFAI